VDLAGAKRGHADENGEEAAAAPAEKMGRTPEGHFPTLFSSNPISLEV
jgi:hypothetical protein